jgi:hypothetical protein
MAIAGALAAAVLFIAWGPPPMRRLGDGSRDAVPAAAFGSQKLRGALTVGGPCSFARRRPAMARTVPIRRSGSSRSGPKRCRAALCRRSGRAAAPWCHSPSTTAGCSASWPILSSTAGPGKSPAGCRSSRRPAALRLRGGRAPARRQRPRRQRSRRGYRLYFRPIYGAAGFPTLVAPEAHGACRAARPALRPGAITPAAVVLRPAARPRSGAPAGWRRAAHPARLAAGQRPLRAVGDAHRAHRLDGAPLRPPRFRPRAVKGNRDPEERDSGSRRSPGSEAQPAPLRAATVAGATRSKTSPPGWWSTPSLPPATPFSRPWRATAGVPCEAAAGSRALGHGRELLRALRRRGRWACCRIRCAWCSIAGAIRGCWSAGCSIGCSPRIALRAEAVRDSNRAVEGADAGVLAERLGAYRGRGASARHRAASSWRCCSSSSMSGPPSCAPSSRSSWPRRASGGAAAQAAPAAGLGSAARIARVVDTLP